MLISGSIITVMLLLLLFIGVYLITYLYVDNIRERQTNYENENYRSLGQEVAAEVMCTEKVYPDGGLGFYYIHKLDLRVYDTIHHFEIPYTICYNKDNYKDVENGDFVILERGIIDIDTVYRLDNCIEKRKLNWRKFLW